MVRGRRRAAPETARSRAARYWAANGAAGRRTTENHSASGREGGASPAISNTATSECRARRFATVLHIAGPSAPPTSTRTRRGGFTTRRHDDVAERRRFHIRAGVYVPVRSLQRYYSIVERRRAARSNALSSVFSKERHASSSRLTISPRRRPDQQWACAHRRAGRGASAVASAPARSMFLVLLLPELGVDPLGLVLRVARLPHPDPVVCCFSCGAARRTSAGLCPRPWLLRQIQYTSHRASSASHFVSPGVTRRRSHPTRRIFQFFPVAASAPCSPARTMARLRFRLLDLVVAVLAVHRLEGLSLGRRGRGRHVTHLLSLLQELCACRDCSISPREQPRIAPRFD